MSRKYSDQQIEQAVLLHQKGYNSVQIAKMINTSTDWVAWQLKRKGFELNGNKVGSVKIYLSDDIKDRIVSLYIEGYSSQKIIYKLNLEETCCDNTIRKIISLAGIKIRKRGYYSMIKNENFFEKIDSELKAYFLGLILTDGYVLDNSKNKKSNVLGIELKESDKYILENLASVFYDAKHLVHKKNKKTYMLTITSNKICQDLSRYGVVPRKTKSVKVPQMENETFQRHLLRGMFDGDGTVFATPKKYIKFGLYGNKETVSWFKRFMEDKLNANEVKITDKRTVCQIIYSSKKDALSFYEWIYKDATVYLIRKKELFEKLLC